MLVAVALRVLRMLPLLLVGGLLAGCPTAAMNRAVASSSASAGTAGAEGTPGAQSPEGGQQGSEPNDPGVGAAASAPADPLGEAEREAPAPATLPLQLAAAGVRTVAAIDRVVHDWESGGLPVRALVFGDDASAHVCVAYDGPARCWTLPLAPTYVADVSVWQSEGRLRLQTSFGLEGGGYVSLTLHGFELRAVRERTGTPSQPVEDVRVRDVPPLFGQVEGLELLMSGATLVARAGEQLRVCRRAEGAFACTEPAFLEPLAGEARALRAVHEDFPGLVGVEYSWEEQVGDVYTTGQALLFLRASATEARQLAHVVVGVTRRARVQLERDDIESLEFEMYDVDARQPGCILAGAPTLRRTVERESGRISTLRAPRLRRAPDVIPLEGVDPLTYDLRGAWAFAPEGGLRRVARCDYEDD